MMRQQDIAKKTELKQETPLECEASQYEHPKSCRYTEIALLGPDTEAKTTLKATTADTTTVAMIAITRMSNSNKNNNHRNISRNKGDTPG